MADREFVAASNLPVTEVEEVNVLVVDPATGVLAQKAGANLSGNNSLDAIIEVNGELYADNVVITPGTFEKLNAMLSNKKFPKIMLYLCETNSYIYSIASSVLIDNGCYLITFYSAGMSGPSVIYIMIDNNDTCTNAGMSLLPEEQ